MWPKKTERGVQREKRKVRRKDEQRVKAAVALEYCDAMRRAEDGVRTRYLAVGEEEGAHKRTGWTTRATRQGRTLAGRSDLGHLERTRSLDPPQCRPTSCSLLQRGCLMLIRQSHLPTHLERTHRCRVCFLPSQSRFRGCSYPPASRSGRTSSLQRCCSGLRTILGPRTSAVHHA